MNADFELLKTTVALHNQQLASMGPRLEALEKEVESQKRVVIALAVKAAREILDEEKTSDSTTETN